MGLTKLSKGNTIDNYLSISTKNNDTLYVCKDGFIFLGNDLIASKGSFKYDDPSINYPQNYDPNMNMLIFDFSSITLSPYAPSFVEIVPDPNYFGTPNWELDLNLDGVFDGEHHIILHEDGAGIPHTLYFNMNGTYQNLHVYSSTEYMNFGKMTQGHTSVVLNPNYDPDGVYDIIISKSHQLSNKTDCYIKVFCLS